MDADAIVVKDDAEVFDEALAFEPPVPDGDDVFVEPVEEAFGDISGEEDARENDVAALDVAGGGEGVNDGVVELSSEEGMNLNDAAAVMEKELMKPNEHGSSPAGLSAEREIEDVEYFSMHEGERKYEGDRHQNGEDSGNCSALFEDNHQQQSDVPNGFQDHVVDGTGSDMEIKEIIESQDHVVDGSGSDMEIKEIIESHQDDERASGRVGYTWTAGTLNEESSENHDCREQPGDGDPVLLDVGANDGNVLAADDVSVSSVDDEIVTSTGNTPSLVSAPSVDRGPSLPTRPAGLGSSAPLLEPAARAVPQPRVNGPSSSISQRQSHTASVNVNEDTDENDETREKLQMIRVKFLRLAHRLGQTPHNVVVAQVLYRLGLAEQLRRNTNRPGVFSFDRASVMAEQLEAAGSEPVDFSCTIMVIGKSGVGKSATINSILDDANLQTDAFNAGTKKVQEVVGTVHGIKVKFIDTPGLSSSSSDLVQNEKILLAVKQYIKKSPPDIVLYIDRLDMQSKDYGDIALLRNITEVFGASIWFNAIIVLTHGASAPPDGPSGVPLSYEMFVSQRSHIVQQAIRQAAGDVRLMNPVSLVENHSACRTNRAGQRVLPNGQVWKPQLLLLSFSSKILAEANVLLKLQDTPPSNLFNRTRSPPLPFLLSSLMQSRPPPKLPEEQLGDDDYLEDDLEEASDSDNEPEYDELPPFKPLTKSQIAKLNKAQKKAYFDELEYREKLMLRKQMKEERKRRKFLKEMAEEAKDQPNEYAGDNVEDEFSNIPASVQVPMPDMVLPSSFDSDSPGHRYRFLDFSNEWLIRPVLESQGWDHDVGYEGINAERLFVIKNKVPLSVSGQLTKDKKDCNLHMEIASSLKHKEGKMSSLGLDFQTVGKDLAYTVRGETRFNNFRRNNTAAGFSATILGDSVSAGLKIEDKLIINKQLRTLISAGAMSGRGDIAYGGRIETTLRDKDYPIGQMLSTLALSVVDWRGDVAVGCNLQSQHPLGRGTNVVGHVNINNRGTGQVGIRLNTSQQLQIALVSLLPILAKIKNMLLLPSESS